MGNGIGMNYWLLGMSRGMRGMIMNQPLVFERTAYGGSPTVREGVGVESTPSLTVGLPPRTISVCIQILSKYRLRSQSVTAELNADCSVRKKCA